MAGREAYELSKQSQLDGDFGKGPGDPDMFGFPGQDDEAGTQEDAGNEYNLADKPF